MSISTLNDFGETKVVGNVAGDTVAQITTKGVCILFSHRYFRKIPYEICCCAFRSGFYEDQVFLLCNHGKLHAQYLQEDAPIITGLLYSQTKPCYA